MIFCAHYNNKQSALHMSGVVHFVCCALSHINGEKSIHYHNARPYLENYFKSMRIFSTVAKVESPCIGFEKFFHIAIIINLI